MKSVWSDALNPHQPRMSFPAGLGEDQTRRFLESVVIEGSSSTEFEAYLDREWRRFIQTWMLCRDLEGRCLEIGASPYFMTALLKEFTRLEPVLSNYATSAEKQGDHVVRWTRPASGESIEQRLTFDLFNVETDPLPYPDDHFDVVLFCEVIEHLTNDPMQALMEIRRVLKPGGRVILTTPNAVSARNVLRIITGKTVHDRYSAYGPYGRHNREYTPAELVQLLGSFGFSVEKSLTANVIFRRRRHLLASFLTECYFHLFSRKRAQALGQYNLIMAVKTDARSVRRPDWLFRSYAENKMTMACPAHS